MAETNLSPMAIEAIEDFKSLLRIMGKDAMDSNDFSAFLSSIGFKGDSKAMFNRLVALTGQSFLDARALQALYTSPTYTSCEDAQETGRHVMNQVKFHFQVADRDGDGLLDRFELEEFVVSFLRESDDVNEEKKEHEPALLDPARVKEMADEIISRAGDAEHIDLEQLASILLRYPHPTQNKERKLEGFDEKFLNPFQSTPDEFVSAVEDFVFQHQALNHHLLDSLHKGAFGESTVGVVTHFLEAYRFFTRNFCAYLSGCIEKVPKEEHVELLTENEEEENGHYDDADIASMIELGLDPLLLQGVAHKDLFVQQVENLKVVSEVTSFNDDELQSIASSTIIAFNEACIDEASTAQSSIAAMYFGSELLVAKLYGQIAGFLKNDERLSTQDLGFFILHIDMDVEHARLMRKIVVDLCDSHAQRECMVRTVIKVLDARVDFYDKFVQCVFPPTGHGALASGVLYNKQSTNWVRKKASCLSDFTGRPIIFDMCSPHIKGAHVLDVGCGEGYGARKLMSMGASAVAGIDISSEMVARARENASSNNESYLVGDATHLQDVIEAHPAALGIVPGAATKIGCFDLAIGIFVFNYTSIFDMNQICHQVHRMLKPGGHFIFSVPHPFMLHAHANQEDTFGFNKGDASASSYFSLRDRKFSGTIKTLDGRILNVKMCFKAISDYMEAVTRCGFDISYMHEARVLAEHVKEHPKFFESVKDSPLHIVFKVQKKAVPAKPTALEKIPKKIRWSPYIFKYPESTIISSIPLKAKECLSHVVQGLIAKGVTAETYELSSADKDQLDVLIPFAASLRERLLCDAGVALVRGGLEVGPSSEEATKLAFYLLASLVGTVDGSARGRLFDVKDCRLNTNNDNVLFSVSNTEATWHTDGASANRSYDVASLLCIQPSTRGGELGVSNAVNAFESLVATIPKFLLYELQRSVPRDIMEDGGGQGPKGDILFDLSRSPELLKHRIRNNAYPIVVATRDAMRFRYMRHWIETGHAKAGLPQSPLLAVAMDLLDSALDENRLWEGRLQPGDVMFCNNLLVAHSRRAFVTDPGDAPRHKVRAWLHCQT